MKALVIHDPGESSALLLEERPVPVAKPMDALVRVRAFGVNRADLLQRLGRYPAPPGVVADIPGLEFAGEIASAPPGSEWAVGDRVMGIVSGGAYAEYVALPSNHLMPIPSHLDFEQAASIPEAFVTAYDAMVLQGKLCPGQTVLVHAIGSGVGTACLEIGRWIGATVMGTSRTQAKLDRLNSQGLSYAVLRTEGWEEAVGAFCPGGVDVVVDLVGGDALNLQLNCIKVQGRVVIVGLVGGVRTSLRMDALLRKRATVKGTVLRSRSDEEKAELFATFREKVIPAFESGALKPRLERVFLAGAVADAHGRMQGNKTFGKIVVAW